MSVLLCHDCEVCGAAIGSLGFWLFFLVLGVYFCSHCYCTRQEGFLKVMVVKSFKTAIHFLKKGWIMHHYDSGYQLCLQSCEKLGSHHDSVTCRATFSSNTSK